MTSMPQRSAICWISSSISAVTLPGDAAGGEGFDNAAETLFLSPIHSEKYLDAAKLRTGLCAERDSKARAKFFAVMPGAGVSPEQAARQ